MREDLKKRWDVLVSYIEDPTRRKQFDNLVSYLKEHSSYFVAPASPAYHCSWNEGLLEHSINVAENACILRCCLPGADSISREEVVIAALFHDLGKAYIEEDQPYYLFKQPSDKQKQYGYKPHPPYEYNKAGQVFMTVPQRAVRVVTQFIDISDECYAAILTHDGQYVEENRPYGCKESPMQLVLHYSDSWAGFTMEGKVTTTEDGKSYKKLPPDDKIGVHGREVRRSRTTE